MASVMAAASRLLLLVLALGLCVEVATTSFVDAKSANDEEEGDVSIRQAEYRNLPDSLRIPWGFVSNAPSCYNGTAARYETARPRRATYCNCTTTEGSLNVSCLAIKEGEEQLLEELPSWGFHNIFRRQRMQIAKAYYCLGVSLPAVS